MSGGSLWPRWAVQRVRSCEVSAALPLGTMLRCFLAPSICMNFQASLDVSEEMSRSRNGSAASNVSAGHSAAAPRGSRRRQFCCQPGKHLCNGAKNTQDRGIPRLLSWTGCQLCQDGAKHCTTGAHISLVIACHRLLANNASCSDAADLVLKSNRARLGKALA